MTTQSIASSSISNTGTFSNTGANKHTSKFFSIRFLRLRILGLGLFVLTGLAQPLPAVAQANNPLVGDWLGSLSTPMGDFRIVFHVRENSGSMQLTMDSPDQNAEGIPAQVTSSAADSVRFDVNVISGYFTGTLEADAILAGSWYQAGMNIPLELKRQ